MAFHQRIILSLVLLMSYQVCVRAFFWNSIEDSSSQENKDALNNQTYPANVSSSNVTAQENVEISNNVTSTVEEETEQSSYNSSDIADESIPNRESGRNGSIESTNSKDRNDSVSYDTQTGRLNTTVTPSTNQNLTTSSSRNCTAEELRAMGANSRTDCVVPLLGNVTEDVSSTNRTMSETPLGNNTVETDSQMNVTQVSTTQANSNNETNESRDEQTSQGPAAKPFFWEMLEEEEEVDEDHSNQTTTPSAKDANSTNTDVISETTGGENNTNRTGTSFMNSTRNGTAEFAEPELLSPEGTSNNQTSQNETVDEPEIYNTTRSSKTAPSGGTNNTSASMSASTMPSNQSRFTSDMQSTAKVFPNGPNQSATTTSTGFKNDDKNEGETMGRTEGEVQDVASLSSLRATRTSTVPADQLGDGWKQSSTMLDDTEDYERPTNTESKTSRNPTEKPKGFFSGYRPHAIHGLVWEDREYMLSVLVPIGCGITGALAIVFAAYTFRNCRRRKRQSESPSPSPTRIAARRKYDQVFLLADSSDED